MNAQALSGSPLEYLTAHPWLVLLFVWALVWKGLALWKASKNNHLPIFIILLILNTVGIAEIIYLGYMYFKTRKASAPVTPTTPTPTV